MRSFKPFHQQNLFLVAALCASFAAVPACGDDDDNGGTGATGGSGGTGGTAGKAGSGGSGGTTGGAAGTGGTAGKDGGAGTAGAAGTGGRGGSAGAAGAGGAAGSGRDGGTDAADGSTDGDASAPTASLRFAHLSPGAPAVDVCIAVHGTTAFTGPLLVANGVTTGLAYSNVTKYLSVGASQFDVRIVAPGSTTCATSLGGLPDITNLPALPAGGSVTIAAEGELNPGDGGGQPFGLKAYVDDTTVTAGKAKLRFVHASSGTPSVDVGLGGGALFTPIFTDVAFGNTAPAANGYVETDPLAAVEISARAHGTTTDVLAIKGANLAAGTIATAFAIGKIGSATSPLKVLFCADNGTPNGMLTPCTVLGDTPQRAHVRVAHLSPDAPAVDVCLTPTGTMFTGTPLLRSLAVTTGLSYSQVTKYLDVPVQAYDVRLVLATATDCATKAVPDTLNVAVTDGLYATVAALGDLMVPDAGAPDAGTGDAGDAGADAGPHTDPGFALKVFVDDHDAPTPAGNILLRFVHASPGTGAVDVGLGSGGAFTTVFGNVAFGMVAMGTGIDANGYFSTAPLNNQTLSARLAGGMTDALVVPGVTIAAGSISTAFAIGNKTGDASKPLKLLLCNDNAAPSGAFTACTVAP